MSDDRVITERTFTVEAANFKHRLGIPFGEGLMSQTIKSDWNDTVIAEWVIDWGDDHMALVEKLRATDSEAMHITVEVNGLYFEKVPRRQAYIEDPSLMLLNPDIEYFTAQRPWQGTYHFKSLAEFEAWVNGGAE